LAGRQDLRPQAFPLPPATRRNPAAGRHATNHSNLPRQEI